MEDEEKCLPKEICYRVASHQLWHGSQTLQHCAVCRGPKRGVEPILKMNMICKSRHIAWSRGNSEGWPRKIWKPPFSEKTELSLMLENNNYCIKVELRKCLMGIWLEEEDEDTLDNYDVEVGLPGKYLISSSCWLWHIQHYIINTGRIFTSYSP